MLQSAISDLFSLIFSKKWGSFFRRRTHYDFQVVIFGSAKTLQIGCLGFVGLKAKHLVAQEGGLYEIQFPGSFLHLTA